MGETSGGLWSDLLLTAWSALRSNQAAEGFIQLQLENLLGWSLGSCPQTPVTSTYRRDKEAEGAPSHRRGLGPYGEPGGRARSKGLISGTRVKSSEVNRLFYRHWFYLVSNFSRHNTAMQPFTVGRPLSEEVSIIRACSRVTGKKTMS